MNTYLVIAGALSIVMGLVHSWMGEKKILVPMFKKVNLPALYGSSLITIRTIRFSWHVTTILLWGLGVILIMIGVFGFPEGIPTIVQSLSIMYFCASLLASFGSAGRHFSWMVFLIISLLIWVSI